MDSHKVDLILQYALVVASENEEPFDRQLGPIHLIKYVYLADLSYSERHNGETFTGAKWRFHNFGPWVPEVYDRIEPALSEIGAQTVRINHPKYEGDFVRWHPPEDELGKELSDQLPFGICVAVKNAVRSFGSDTATLLNHVYLTEPMLCAAPGENLDFKCRVRPPDHTEETPQIEPIRAMTKKQRDERKQKIQNLRSLIRERLDNRKKDPELVTPDPPPRYDEVFLQGLAYMEAEAGPPIEEREEKAGLSDDVWKSPARYDPDLS